MNRRRADPSGITFAFAEGALLVNVILWLGYAHRPAGAAVAIVAMLIVWQAHRWASR